MRTRCLLALLSLAVFGVVAWIGGAGPGEKKIPDGWAEVMPGVFRSPGLPAGYALVHGERALLIDAAAPDGLRAHGVKTIDAVLLTHHHRDTCAGAGTFLSAGIPVRAPKASADWLRPEGVRKYWAESLPLRSSRTAYLVVPAGFDGIDCALQDGQKITWNGWTVEVVATPGHSPDHVAFAARKDKDGPLLLFCGDALAAPGKLWSPYTTDWDHWTDAGLAPAAKSLPKLAGMKPSALLPAHGPITRENAVAALERTAAAVEEVAFLKSFERFTKKRLGNAPAYRFLAIEQAESNGSKPWSQISPHLFLTGNTYLLVSDETKAMLVVDPWGKVSAQQVRKLQADRKLGPIEVVMFSHAHYDHYDGIYDLPGRERFEVWALDRVAVPIADPFLLRAPFLDARAVKIDRRPKDGDTLAWREYRFRFHHFPGQSEFTMGVEATIDGKRCFFTADNFFHQDQFSGSGGWMGLNRSFPLPYAASAKKVLDAAPDWVLAEHGGPFEFNAEDFRRRVRWGEVSAAAADALCVTGNHRHDWDPHLVRVEPLVLKAAAGAKLNATLVVSNPLPQQQKLSLVLGGRGWLADQTFTLEVPAGGTVRRGVSLSLAKNVPAGRQVFVVESADPERPLAADAFVVVDVKR